MISQSLSQLLSEAGLPNLGAADLAKFDTYLALLLRWNARTNLTAVRDADGILRRHFIESIACAWALPGGIQNLLDFATGAGFPGIPIAICRPDIEVTLAESQHKKSAFLNEAITTLGLQTKLFRGRAEEIGATFDCVTLRAVDRMQRATTEAVSLLNPAGILALLTTTVEFPTLEARIPGLVWKSAIRLPGSDQRVLRLGSRRQ